uniref:Uncharacterized protein n=1 Tax=Arundo donax TaxID=35708 RepID=A0A0A9DW02_ARUDO
MQEFHGDDYVSRMILHDYEPHPKEKKHHIRLGVKQLLHSNYPLYEALKQSQITIIQTDTFLC